MFESLTLELIVQISFNDNYKLEQNRIDLIVLTAITSIQIYVSGTCNTSTTQNVQYRVFSIPGILFNNI